MRSLRYGCRRTRSSSACVSGPRLSQIAFETPRRPRSCTRPARRRASRRRPAARRARRRAARSATPRECPIVYGDLRSVKSPIASRPSSSSASDEPLERRLGRDHRVPVRRRVEVVEQRRAPSGRRGPPAPGRTGCRCAPWRPRRPRRRPPLRWKTVDHIGELSPAATSAGSARPCAPPARPCRPSARRTPSGSGAPPGRARGAAPGRRREPVVLEHLHRGRATLGPEAHARGGRAPASPRPAPEVAQHERRAAAPVMSRPEVGLERQVVAEPLRLLVGVGVAPDPGEQARRSRRPRARPRRGPAARPSAARSASAG